MLTGLDHLIVAVRDPDRAAEALEQALGLRAGPGGRHEAHGTFNRLIWLGDSYVELMGVFDERLASESWWGKHAIAVLDAGGGMMGLALASDDASADAALLRSGGSTLRSAEEGERRRPDGGAVRWQLARPPSADPDLGLVFLITHDQDAAEWTAGERAVRAAAVHPLGTPARLERAQVRVGDIRAATTRIHRELGLAFRPSLAGGGARDAAVGAQTLRLVASRAQREPEITLRGGTEPRRANVLGCRWLIEPSTR